MEYTDIELKNEKWKDIFGYDGMYHVSDFLPFVVQLHSPRDFNALERKYGGC